MVCLAQSFLPWLWGWTRIGSFTMTPEAALEAQIARYRQMTGEQRLALALDLHELSCDVAREGIRNQHPGITSAEVEQLLRQRLELVTRP